jgi:hypothetical protein
MREGNDLLEREVDAEESIHHDPLVGDQDHSKNVVS